MKTCQYIVLYILHSWRNAFSWVNWVSSWGEYRALCLWHKGLCYNFNKRIPKIAIFTMKWKKTTRTQFAHSSCLRHYAFVHLNVISRATSSSPPLKVKICWSHLFNRLGCLSPYRSLIQCNDIGVYLIIQPLLCLIYMLSLTCFLSTLGTFVGIKVLVNLYNFCELRLIFKTFVEHIVIFSKLAAWITPVVIV